MMTPKERAELIDALLDGDISDADFLRIEAELSVDPSVRQEYYKSLKLNLLLEREARNDSTEATWQRSSSDLMTPDKPSPDRLPPTTGNPEIRVARPRRLRLVAGILISLAATFSGAVFLFPINLNPDKTTIVADNDLESTATGFAVLAGQSDAIWEGQPMTTGSLLPPGELHLKSGLAHIELFSGVQMVIQGDALFSIDSAMNVSLIRGRASANVPEAAHGFRISTRQGDVVDLGTEFAIDVSAESSRVEVVNGEVELHPRGLKSQRLIEGESVELSENGINSDPKQATLGVVSAESFKEALSSRQADRFQRWVKHNEMIQQDDRLLAYYQVDPKHPLSRQLPNLAEHDHEIAGDGAIVACERTKNRWGDAEGALNFSRMGSRVRVNVPGEMRGLTLMCWVKINSLDREFNSLFLTDGHELNEPHWQIMDDGRLFFSVKKRNLSKAQEAAGLESKHDFYSPKFWDSSLSGKWMMLATVYNVDEKLVTHFVDGKVVSHEPVPNDFLVEHVKIGPACIGNWSKPIYRAEPEFVVRNFNGTIDEFSLFAGPLSVTEIAEHFRVGNPD